MGGGILPEIPEVVDLKMVFLIDLLHQFIHSCALGAGMLPKLSGETQGTHVCV